MIEQKKRGERNSFFEYSLLYYIYDYRIHSTFSTYS